MQCTKDTNNKIQLLDYFEEAFSLNTTIIKKNQNKQEIIIPELLQTALDKNPLAKENFDNMAYTYRKSMPTIFQMLKKRRLN